MTRTFLWLTAGLIAWSTPSAASETQPDALASPSPGARVSDFAAPANYAAMVARLKSGGVDVDFAALREAAMGVPGYSGYRSLNLGPVSDAAGAKDWEKVLALCDAHLLGDFTDINAHFFEAVAYRELGKTALAERQRGIWRGLFEAILKSGDGKSPRTAFRVLGVDEEYFLLRIFDLRPGMQALVNKDGVFDRFEVTAKDGSKQDVWFDISGFFGKGFGL